MRALFLAIGTFVERHPLRIVTVAVVLTLLAVLGVSSTQIVTTQDAFVPRDSPVFQGYEAYERAFGGDPLVVLIPGSPDQLTSPATLTAMRSLHAKLSGDPAVRSVVSIVTLLQAAAPPGAPAPNPNALRSIVYTPDGNPQPQFAAMLPRGHSVMVVRLAGGLTVDQQRQAADRVLEAVRSVGLPAGTTVAGTPRLIGEITTSITKDMAITGGIAIALMIVVLYLVFPVRRRLLALPIVVVGVLWTFGATSAMSIPLTLVTMAGLPVLVGLGVDFAIQFHNRYEEEIHRGQQPDQGLLAAVTRIGPAVGIAVAASALGFITLLLSRVPAVREFGLLLAIGVVALYAAGLFGLNALLYRYDRPRNARKRVTMRRRWTLADRLPVLSTAAVRRGPLVAVVAILLAAGGYAVDGRLAVQTDIEKLIPSDTPGVVALRDARDVIGTTNSVPLLISARDVTDPRVLAWMKDFQSRVLRDHPQVLSAESLATALPPVPGSQPASNSQAIAQAVQAMPADVRRNLITDDRTGASLTFNIAQMPIAELNTLIGQIVAEAQPPDGVSVVPGGTLTLAGAAVSAVTERRTAVAVTGFLAVFVGLLLIYRNWRRAIAPVVPVVLVTGWSSGVMWLLGIELNPLTAVMSALIIGIGTEFAILLLERYEEERATGAAPTAAINQAVTRVGQAVTASALTVAAGFGALLASSFPALREFAAVTVINVLLSLLATLVIIPPLIVRLDRRRAPMPETPVLSAEMQH
ncbi:hypothetical protein TH66_04730 [Carbonactinospora thermoautotrophica]|uniref:SSD domain-containing protein n=1 Tax=Carbonactinospora thermoautotrophica TaxID=1469144 RepID=A0A132N7D9_9ACTN|nr:hydrophobe/amphiphile efflux-3 (HAE3) family transporter [Carbonactinospora thermoautotrophica]KWX05055.1 hypothetical protein TH66_04730 [Carbonactinospora thermoautotrophica]KWX06075.1 hypothetical protein TR74_23105 [Carbonactinospora thermoautotrophica]